MEQSPNFQLQGFVIPKFSFSEADSKYSTIDIQLYPTGKYNTSNGQYELIMPFTASAFVENQPNDKTEIITGLFKAFFLIDGKIQAASIPDYFYSNSLGIIYPFLRGFISNITLQAGTRLLILPVLNLMSLGDVLKKNTVVFE
ncbi:MAG TPA: hypothetical protein VK645_17370 [Chitinophagaceae bacterium]|nr:hypothetical protein [Chitinophagaceae bacterium]